MGGDEGPESESFGAGPRPTVRGRGEPSRPVYPSWSSAFAS